jgi:methionyl-tRNA synthetase
MEPYYLTTPIYYVNSTPHIGHAYTTVAADVFARHQRQRGHDTFLLTGVDEHASKVARVAAEQGLEPQEYADRIVEAWRALPALLGVAHDFFIRTTDDGHKRFVQEFLQRIRDNGRDDIYQDVYAGFYCVGCEAFKTEEELVDGKCPEHGIEPEWIEEKNWFFRLSAYQERLLALYDERPDFVLPAFRANEARGFIAGGLQDFSISRAGQPWGVPIPWDPGQVAYVWADALVNYLSALTYARPGEDLVPRYWPAVRHLLAKDILRFHCVYWPAMLLAAGYDVPRQLFVHGYLLLDDRKISKSLGNVLDPLDLVDVYGADAVRFWCARSVSFGHDGTASIESLRERYERELGNDLGNLLSRVTAMVARYRHGTLAAVPADDSEVAGFLAPLGDDVAARLDAFDLTGALERIWEVVRALNRHVEATAPWKLAKDDARAVDLDRVLYDLVDGLRAVSVALAAYLPVTAERILEALGQPVELAWGEVAYGRTRAVDGVEPAAPLFPRVDEPAPAA